MMLPAKVKETLHKHRMLSPGDRVVVAVSGGPDSVCLLRALMALAPDRGLSLHIAHLDHRFRGPESAAEARFVERLARDLGVPATIDSRDVPAYCAERGLSAQAGAREVRYAFLREVAQAEHAARIALGHTANDQAETLLMRLIRGAGTAGLSAIPPTREDIIRPLITATRDEVLEYLNALKQDFVTDPSNEKPLYTRNRIRRDVLPLLAGFNPRIVETLAAEADMLRDEDAALETMLDDAMARTVRLENGRVRILREAFNGLLPALRRRVLRQALMCLGRDDGPELSSVQTGEAVAFMEAAQTGRDMDLPRGLVLAREYDDCIIRRRADRSEYSVTLAVPGRTAVPEAGIVVEVTIADEAALIEEDDQNNLWQAQFDYAKIALPLYLRNRREGYRFCPAGMHGRSKKLQDYFTDGKVPKSARDAVPLLTTGQDLLWVVGMRTDDRFLPGPGAQQVLVVTVRKIP
ncbi:MAG: tRNA lysidine(34) synthetase TilS [Nitrospirota bacterium]